MLDADRMDDEPRPFDNHQATTRPPEPVRIPEPESNHTMKKEPAILGLATAAIVGILAALLLPSCSNIPAGIIQPGATGYITQTGGSMTLKSPAGAELAINNEASFKALTKTLDNGIIAWAATKIIDGLDTNATDVDKANIDAQAQATSQQNANAAAKEANRHTETMATLAEEPIIPTIQTP